MIVKQMDPKIGRFS